MKSKSYYFSYVLGLILCMLVITSCESFLQGMSQGVSGYGMGYGAPGYGMGYGMPVSTGPSPMGGTYIGSIYCPPINTQAIQQATETIKQQAVQNMVETAKTTQRVKAQIEAQTAYDVQHGIVPVYMDNSSSSISSSTSGKSFSSSNLNDSHKFQYGDKTCSHCMGSGVCSSCNGTGIQNHMNTTLCGVCYNHDGKCKWCSGRGSNYGLISR